MDNSWSDIMVIVSAISTIIYWRTKMTTDEDDFEVPEEILVAFREWQKCQRAVEAAQKNLDAIVDKYYNPRPPEDAPIEDLLNYLLFPGS